MVDLLDGWMLVGWYDGWLVERLVGWLNGWFVGWFNERFDGWMIAFSPIYKPRTKLFGTCWFV